MTIEATESDFTVADVPRDEVFPVEEFGEFRIRLVNGDGTGEVIDFGEWKERNKRV